MNNSNLLSREEQKQLALAARKSDHKRVESISRSKERVDINLIKEKAGDNLLHSASRRGRVEVVRYLVEKQDGDVESRNKDGWTPLHLASRYGYSELVLYLSTERGANIECQTTDGWRPIHFASSRGHLQVVQFLVEQNGEIECQTKDGWTPLHFACESGYLNTANYLSKERPSIVECETNDGWRPLHFACSNGHLDVVQLLLDEQDADIKHQTNNSETVLHLACKKGHLDLVKYLVGKPGVSMKCKTKDGETALQLAEFYNNTVVVEYLNSMPDGNKQDVDSGVSSSRTASPNSMDAATSSASAARHEITDEKPEHFQPTLWLNKSSINEEVGEFPQHGLRDSSVKFSKDCEPCFYLCHTGKDDMKENIARPTHWFLKNILKVGAFIDDGDMMVAKSRDETLAKEAYECTHAVVIVSPQFRHRKYCVMELNTFMRRRAEDDGIQIILALWGVQSVDGYSSELDDLVRLRQHSGTSEVDFLVLTLWPALMKILKKPPIGRKELEVHLHDYVLETRGFRTIPSFLEVHVKRTESNTGKRQADDDTARVADITDADANRDSDTDALDHAELSDASVCVEASQSEEVDDVNKANSEEDECLDESTQQGNTDGPFHPPHYNQFGHDNVSYADDSDKERRLIFHCVRGRYRVDVWLPVNDTVTLQDLYDELSKNGNKNKMFPDNFEEVRLRLREKRRSREVFLVSSSERLSTVTTQQAWELGDCKTSLWVKIVQGKKRRARWWKHYLRREL